LMASIARGGLGLETASASMVVTGVH